MSGRAGGRRIWILFAAHLLLGTALLGWPRVVLRAVAGAEARPPTWIARILGIRVLAQAGAEAVRPSRALLRTAVAVDVAHGASMIAAAQLWPRYRRTALASAGSAGVSAVAGALLARARR
ncbi:MAG: hypothetical protein M3Z00_12455 [Actinomycetota bacterium]|nr:hypothetical protein [Actinomycetota bacterium]